ncbi:uncharacterized protein LOC132402424 [Hypanus sabinus]|uniref:uncharacterized protein LOC132402424 n=1 Tax=Hypanus sabinus TaxID=79690 RepID=UPI0028C450C2|nr:uncharacterized protein LOC132402424 [Hypanus sabinus]
MRCGRYKQKSSTALSCRIRGRGWVINMEKIQGPSQGVIFLGVQWTSGHRSIPDAAKNKILNFAVPSTDTQRFAGLLGFWREQIPHLTMLLRPLYRISRKKSTFLWGPAEQAAFDTAKLAVKQAMPLTSRQGGLPFELQLPASETVAEWSLWQKTPGRRVPLGFWTKSLPEAAVRYSPFERQLLACYLALLTTEHQTGTDPVVLRPHLPIMRWVKSPDSTHKEGRAQRSSIVKWKWYTANQAEPNPEGVSRHHEQVMAFPQSQDPAPDIPEAQSSPACWSQPFDSLDPDSKLHAWFTDGSSRWKGGKQFWKAATFHPATGRILTTEGKGDSSQLVELAAVDLTLQNTTGPVHIYTDSWTLANGIAVWMARWQVMRWEIHGRSLWGQHHWRFIWDQVTHRKISVHHVDAHTRKDNEEATFKAAVDQAAQVSSATTSTPDTEHSALAAWAHRKCGHLGADGTRRWAEQFGVALTLDQCKTSVDNCPICQQVKPRDRPIGPPGHIRRGTGAGQVWQIDYIGPLPRQNKKQYDLTMVDIYSGVLVAVPCERADQNGTISGLQHLSSHYGVPWEVQSDQGSHFAVTKAQTWAAEAGISWLFHIPDHPRQRA